MGIICTIPEPHFEQETEVVGGEEVAPVLNEVSGKAVEGEEVEVPVVAAKSNLLFNPYLNRYPHWNAGWNNGGYNPYNSLYNGNPYLLN